MERSLHARFCGDRPGSFGVIDVTDRQTGRSDFYRYREEDIKKRCLSVCLFVWADNSVLHGWSECMSDLHIPHEKEPRNLYVNTEDCPDITFFDAESGQNLDVDISLAHPWSQGILKRSSREDGFAARTREEKKTNKYTGEILPGGKSSKCISLVFEHFGRWACKLMPSYTLSQNSAAVLRKTPFVVQNNSKLFGGNCSL